MNLLRAATIPCFLAGFAFAQEGSFERSLNVSGPVDLEAITDSGGIVVTTGSSGSVRIRGILKVQHNGFGWIQSGDAESRLRRLEQNPPIQQIGNRVVVGHVDKSLLRGISMRLEITTPADSRLRARADSGGITVEGLRGPVDCEADSGGVRIRDITSEVRAKTDSGGIHIERVQGPVYARADSGGIDALDVAGSIDVATDSGGMKLSQTKPDIIRAKADSGGANIRLVSNAGYNVRADSDSGNIHVSDVTVRGTLSKHHIEGTVRGGGPLVAVSVESGTIVVE